MRAKPKLVFLDEPQPVEVEYQFNDADRLQLGDVIARLVVELNELEDRKKSAAADFKAAMESKAGELRLLTGKVRRGGELRQVEARVALDVKARRKFFLHPETRAVLKETEMTAADMQPELPMGEPAGRR